MIDFQEVLTLKGMPRSPLVDVSTSSVDGLFIYIPLRCGLTRPKTDGTEESHISAAVARQHDGGVCVVEKEVPVLPTPWNNGDELVGYRPQSVTGYGALVHGSELMEFFFYEGFIHFAVRHFGCHGGPPMRA